MVLLLPAGCGNSEAPVPGPPAADHRDAPAACANIAPDPFVTRNDLAPGSRSPNARLLLRFVQFTDDHILDDDGEALIGGAFLDPLHPTFEAAQRFQGEYSDEALNRMIAEVNDCVARFPAEFMIVTGDSADLTTVAETRRFIDNLDGSFDQPSAFEARCLADLPEGAPPEVADQLCTRYTGRGVADTQAVDPDPDDPLYQLLPTRTVQQLLNTELAALGGRAADGSSDPARQTGSRSPGLPQELRCNAGEPGCINAALALPWYVAFGNHDGYLRGTLPVGDAINAYAEAIGRRFVFHQSEFIEEFFQTRSQPVGHGFNFADAARREDADPRNDGYYALDAGAPGAGGDRFRLIVLNTIIDGTQPGLPEALLRHPFALSDGTIGAAQFAWLQDELAQAAARRQLVLVFSHHPDPTFAEYGMFATLVPIEVTAAQLDAELASWPNLIAWIAGHTHRHRVRAFKVEDGQGSNGLLSVPVQCKGPGACRGFWQIESASLIDHPQEQRLIEIFDNGDGTGTIRAPVLTHGFEKSKHLAERDDRCQLYLSDPAAVAAGITEAGLAALCLQGGTRPGEPTDRNVDLQFHMPAQ